MFAILLFGAKLVRVRMSTWVAALCVIGFCATLFTCATSAYPFVDGRAKIFRSCSAMTIGTTQCSRPGRIRAANVFGAPDAAVQLRAALAPFADTGIVGTVAHRSRRLGTTDATTFSRAGLTSIGLIQDPIEYGTVTEHSNLDTFEAIHEQDVRDAAALVASLAFTLANCGAPLARFAPQDMPAPRGPAPDSHAAARAPNP
jgi:hypothetical protein